ncbi:MAG: glycosyl hydrolase family 8 [Bacteroidales bacterium]|nr:glycosyl hydrolase family 8 [Bacteroidales bacterium]
MKKYISAFVYALFVVLAVEAQNEVTVHINSGNPAFPFPQFLSYSYGENHTLDNLGTVNPEGVVHAEMEQDIRDAYQIFANEWTYTGDEVNGVKYIRGNLGCPYDCREGDGYSLLAAAIMGDKVSFDGLWMCVHDKSRVKQPRYIDGVVFSPDYGYGDFSIKDNQDAATDGDVDIALALYIAWRQWGDFMGVNDSKGNPISYKKELIDVLKGFIHLQTRFPADGEPRRYLSGEIGLDGYLKNGNTWPEASNYVTQNPMTVDGILMRPEFAGPTNIHSDYLAPSYFREFYDLLGELNPEGVSEFERNQFKRCEASSDWLVGNWISQNPKYIFVGEETTVNEASASVTVHAGNQGGRFRSVWRTAMNYVWHGNPDYTWDPVTHTLKNTSNTYEYDGAVRYSQFMNDPQKWGNAGCTEFGGGPSVTYKGPATLHWDIGPTGDFIKSEFIFNWIAGCGSMSAIAAQDMDLLGVLYRTCNIEWDVTTGGDGYLSSVPHYFHGWFRLLGMLTATGNHIAPSQMLPKANMKVYRSIEDSLSFAYTGDEFTYFLDYRNYGSVDGKDVKIVEHVPDDFIFVSAANGGVYDAASHTVTWNIGTVPGVKTGSIDVTKGQVSYKVKVGPKASGRYCTTAEISCSNGLGWTSNEYPNYVTSTMQRNCVDVIKRSLIIEKTANLEECNPGNVVTYTINFENSSEAGWLDGGRPRVNIGFSNGGLATQQEWLRFRLYNDAIEPYINYGNYRISYYMYDAARKSLGDPGWGWYTAIYEGKRSASDKISVSHETVVEGSDSYGKWNQRMILQFAPLLVTTTGHLSNYYGMGARIHRGGTEPLRVAGYIHPNPWVDTDFSDDWSWDAAAQGAEDGNYYPVTPSWQRIDQETGKSIDTPVNEYIPSFCDVPTHTVSNVLVEEFDGYVWRRILGTGPMAGRDMYNVVVCDTLPKGLSFLAFQNNCPLESFGATMTTKKTADGRDIIIWKIPTMQIKQKGTIKYTATATFPSGKSCQTDNEDIDNVAWIYADMNSPVGDTATVTVTCAKVPAPIVPTTLTKTPDQETVSVGDDVTYTLEYEQTHGFVTNDAAANASDWTVSGGSVSGGVASVAANSNSNVKYNYSYAKNIFVEADCNFTQYADTYWYFRDNISLSLKVDYGVLKVQCGSKSADLVAASGDLHVAVDVTDDILRMWVGATSVDTSETAAFTVENVSTTPGYFGFKNTAHGNHKYSNIHVHTDYAYDLSIIDEMPSELTYVSSDNGGALSGSNVVWEFEHGLANPIPLGQKYTVTVTASVNECSEKIINEAHVSLLGHADDEIRAQAVVECGSSCPGKPKVTSPVTYCQGDEASALEATGTALKWYTKETGGTATTSVIPSTSTAGKTTYYVSQTENGCESPRAAVEVEVFAKPETPTITTNSPVCVGDELTFEISEVTGATYAWEGPESFTSTEQNPTIASVSLTAAGDYSVIITDANGCVSEAGTTTVVVNEIPEMPTVESPIQYCQGETVTEEVSATGTALKWYTTEDGTVEFATLVPVTTKVGSVHYYVSQTVKGCESERADLEVKTLAPPSVPVITTNSPVCPGGSIELSTTSEGSYTWTGPNSFTSTEQNPVIDDVVAASAGEYTLMVKVGNCSSEVTTATVVVKATPATPSPSNNGPKCAGEDVSLSVTAVAGATYSWVGPDGFTSTDQNPKTTVAGEYSLVVTVADCPSEAATTTVVINEIPEKPAIPTAPYQFCKGETVSDEVTATGENLTWYTTADGSTKFVSLVPSTTTVGSVHYYVSQTVVGCESERADIEVKTLEPPSVPVITTNSPVCLGEDLSLETTAEGTYAWTGPNGFTSTEKNPVFASTADAAGDYSLIVTVGNCTSEAGETTVVVNPIPSVIINPVDAQCVDAADLTLSVTATPVGGIGTFSGEGVTGTTFSPSKAGVGSHTITYSYEVNGCSKSESITIDVQEKPEVSFTLPTTTCKSNSVIALTGNQTGGTFSANPSLDVTAGFNPANATIGQEYTITYDYTDGVCSNSVAHSITVYDPIKPVGTDVSKVYTKVTASDIPTLSATGVNQIWYSDAALTNKVGEGATFTPAAADVIDGTTGKVGVHTYYVVSTEGGCVSEKTPVALEISSCAAEAPVPVKNMVAVCAGETSDAAKTLSVTAGTGNIRWYYNDTKLQDDAATTFVPTETAEGSYTFYVSLYDTDANCESGKSSITYIINKLPSVSFDLPAEVCAGSTEIDLTTYKSQVAGTIVDESLATVTKFKPITAGTYSFTYSYTDENSCTNTASDNIIVNDLPSITVTPVAAMCEYDSPLDLTSVVSPKGGKFSGDGVVASTFNPAAVVAGSTASITYSYTDSKSCANSETFDIAVVATPQIKFSTIANSCIGDAAFDLMQYVTPTTGTFSGEHISGSKFDPSASGSFEITYTVTENGCENAMTKFAKVNKLPTVSITTNAVECVNTGLVEPVISPAGGALKIDGAGASSINTNVLAVGDHTILYEYTDATTNCSNSDSKTFELREIAAPSVSDKTVVVASGDLSLTVTGNGGAYTWTDESGNLVGIGPSISHIYADEVGDWTYCVAETDGVCTSEPACMTFSIIECPIPAPDVVESVVSGCTNGTMPTLAANGDYTIQWYKEYDRNAVIAVGSTYVPNDVVTTGVYNYYVTQSDAVCESQASKVTLQMFVTPQPKVMGNKEICENEDLELLADQEALWYTESSLSHADKIGVSHTVSYATVGTYQLYVTRQDEHCVSNPVTVTIKVNAIPDAPTINVDDACQGEDVEFTAIGSNIQWYRSGILMSDEDSYVEKDALPGMVTIGATQTVSGCVSPIAEATAIIFAVPSAPQTIDVSICDYDKIQPLSVVINSDATAQWYADEDCTALLSAGMTEYTPKDKKTQSFYVTQTENNCVSEPAKVTLTVNPKPEKVNFKQSTDVVACEGNQVVLIAESSNKVYWYDSPTDFPIFTGRYFTLPTSEVGEYTFYASQTDAAGCKSDLSSKNVSIQAGPQPALLIQSDTICEYEDPGRLIVARNSEHETVSWISPTGATLSLGDTLDIPAGLIKKAGVYTFKARTTVASCSFDTKRETKVVYVVYKKPDVPTLTKKAFCHDGQTVTLTTKAKNPMWFNSDKHVVMTGSEYQTLNSAVGNYEVWMTQMENGCISDTTKISYLISAIPNPVITGETGVCTGANEVYVVTKESDANTIAWSITGNRVSYELSSYSSGFVRSVDWTEEGFDTITVRETNKYGCVGTNSLVVAVTPSPDVQFITENLGQEGVVTFTNLSEAQILYQGEVEKEFAVDYFWDFGRKLDTALVLDNRKIFDQNYRYGNYTAELTAVNEFGCSSSLKVPFFVDVEHGLYVPTAFAPENPADEVRKFKPKGFNCRTFEIWIYDNWNNLVYYSSGVNEHGCPLAEWDGMVNGKLMQAGTYRYKIEVTFEDHSEENFKIAQSVKPIWGNVVLIR